MIVYNGEVFNYRELRRDLERRGVAFRTDSDTEVVLLGYVHDGEAILQRLRGMFAFVVWDRRTNEIFAARDQIGVKPLYYYVDEGLFAACSEIRPLLSASVDVGPARPRGRRRVPLVRQQPRQPDRGRGHPGAPARPRPAHPRRRGDRERVLGRAAGGRGTASPAEAEDALAALLEESVALSLVSDVPLGLMLSGGIDSSLFAALAVRHAPAVRADGVLRRVRKAGRRGLAARVGSPRTSGSRSGRST